MKKTIIALAITGVLAASACKSLDVAPPNSISDPQIQALLASGDEKKVADALNAIGGGMEQYFNYYSTNYTGYSTYALNAQLDQEFIFSMMGNDVVLGTRERTKGGHAAYYDMTAVTWFGKDISGPFWNMPVDFFSAANKVLNFITPDVVAQNPSLRESRADALLVRAWGYLNLIERFQPAYALNPGADGLPVYTEYKVNAPAAISSAKRVYELIESWVAEAIELYKAAGTGYTPEVNDLDLGVAQYVQMRTAVNFTDWNTAISAGEELVANYKTFIPEAAYGAKNADLDAYAAGTKELNAADNAFLCAEANPEAILAFPVGANYNRSYIYDAANVMGGGSAGAGERQPRIDQRLLDRISPDDFRKDIFSDHAVNFKYVTKVAEGTTNTIAVPAYVNLKFGATEPIGATVRNESTQCDDIVIRASEVYLMLAEAYAQAGDDTKAKNTVNALLAARAKTGKTLNIDSYGTGTLLEKIRLQYRIEMWLEKGLEFFNNKRWGIDVARTGSATHYSTNGLTVDEMVIEVPADEQRGNKNWK